MRESADSPLHEWKVSADPAAASPLPDPQVGVEAAPRPPGSRPERPREGAGLVRGQSTVAEL